jgi:hypothetical protein
MFWSALRRLGARAVADGILEISDLRKGIAEACTLSTRQELTSPPKPAERDQFGECLRRYGDDDPFDGAEPDRGRPIRPFWPSCVGIGAAAAIRESFADAITGLVSAALDAGLRPR